MIFYSFFNVKYMCVIFVLFVYINVTLIYILHIQTHSNFFFFQIFYFFFVMNDIMSFINKYKCPFKFISFLTVIFVYSTIYKCFFLFIMFIFLCFIKIYVFVLKYLHHIYIFTKHTFILY